MKTKKTSRRMTRRSFKRKLIMFGASIFASLAITATGFATWVLSTDASSKNEGGIEVASVSDAGVGIESIAFLDRNGDDPIRNFKFEPVAGDTTGRVRVDEDNNSEDMDVRLGWTVKNYQHIASSVIDFKIPEGVYNAIQKGYIALPAAFVQQTNNGEPKTEVIDSVKYYLYKFTAPEITANGNTDDNILAWTVNQTQDVTDVTFVLTLKFVWGETFDGDGDGIGENPSIYYDKAFSDSTKGIGVEYQTAKATLLDLKASIFNVTEADKSVALSKIGDQTTKNSVSDKGIMEVLGAMSAEEQNAFYSTKAAPKYKVVIHAIVK